MHPLLAQFSNPGLSFGMPGIFIFIFVVMFIVVVGIMIFNAAKGVKEWADNNQQPVETLQATVMTKRTRVSSTGGNNEFTSTHYFATFQFASGSRQEFNVSAHAYAFLAEGDVGQLSHQGTRYKGFQRTDGTSQSEQNAGPAATTADQAANKKAFCPFCGDAVGPEFKFCPKCGKSLPEPAPATG